MNQIAIIGAGLAGWSVVDALRTLDKACQISLISADSADRYHKPMLSNAISQNKSAQSLVRTAGADAAALADITLIPNTKVIDIQDKNLITDTGQVLPFRHLVLAIGANPIYPDYLPASEKIIDINHLDGLKALEKHLDAPKRIAILGAGMVGVELAEDLTVAGHQITLLDNNPYPLANLLPAVAGARLLDALTALGIDFCGVKVKTVSDDKEGLLLTTDTGELMVDVLIVATGLMVDGRLPRRLGLDFDERLGILVNDDMTTNIEHIYAIGDCMAINGRPCRFVAPHRAQATAIAHHILGLAHQYQFVLPMIRLKNKAITIQATGTPNGKVAGWQVLSDEADKMVLEQMVGQEKVASLSLSRKPAHS